MKWNHRTLNSSSDLQTRLKKLAGEQPELTGRIVGVNRTVQQLHEWGLLNETLELGPIVLQRSQGNEGPPDTAQLIQAGLCSEQGLVAVYWDTEDYAAATDEDPLLVLIEAIDRAQPLGKCEPLVRWLVAEHADRLLEQLMRNARILT